MTDEQEPQASGAKTEAASVAVQELGGYDDPRLLKIVTYVLELYSWTEIANMIGISRNALNGLRERYKLDEIVAQQSIEEFETLQRGRLRLVRRAQQKLLEMLDSKSPEAIQWAIDRIIPRIETAEDAERIVKAAHVNTANAARLVANSSGPASIPGVVEDISVKERLERATKARAAIKAREKETITTQGETVAKSEKETG